MLSPAALPRECMQICPDCMHATKMNAMGATVQVRDLDEGVQERLRLAAEREGMSLSAFLRRELTRLVDQLEIRARADALRSRNRLGVSKDFFSGISSDQIVAMIREDRDR